MSIKTQERPKNENATSSPVWLDVVRSKVEGLRYGSVQIVVHEGRVTQVESIEKTRFQAKSEEQG